MKKWLQNFLELDKLFIGVRELDNQNKVLLNHTIDLNNKLVPNDSTQISTALQTLNNKVDELIPVKNEFSPSDLAINDVLGNLVLNFSLKGKDEVDLTKAKRIHGAALFGTSALNISAFQGISQNLFYATANPSTLMTLNSGVGSAIMSSSGIVGQAPFISAGLGAFAPILLFQATSMMIIQSSINNLTERVELVKKKVEFLLKYTEKENEATLITINEKLIALDAQKFYTTEDFVLLENYKDRLSILSNQYRLLALDALTNFSNENSKVENQNDEDKQVEVKKKLAEKGLNVFYILGKKVSKIADKVISTEAATFISKNILELLRNSNGDVSKIKQDLIDSKFQYFLVLSSIAENLYYQTKFLELKMNYAQINPDSNRIEKAKYLLKNFKEDSAITLNSQNQLLLENVKQTLLDQILDLQKKSDWKRENIEFLKNEILQSFSETKAIIIKNQDEIINLKNSLNKEKTLELAIDYKDGQENIYILNA